MTLDEKLRLQARALYALGSLLLIMAIMQAAGPAFPVAIHNVQWRYGMFAGAFTSIGGVLLGLAIIIVAAVMRKSLRLLAVLSALCMIAAVSLVAGAFLYLLDALQLRGLASNDARELVLRGMVVGTVAAFLGAATFVAFSITAWKLSHAGEPLTNRELLYEAEHVPRREEAVHAG